MWTGSESNTNKNVLLVIISEMCLWYLVHNSCHLTSSCPLNKTVTRTQCLFQSSNVSICKELTLTTIACDTHHRAVLVLVFGVLVWIVSQCKHQCLAGDGDIRKVVRHRERDWRHDNHHHDSVSVSVWRCLGLVVVYLPWFLSTSLHCPGCGCNKDTQIVQIPITLWPARPLGCGQPIFTQVYVAL